MRCFIAIDIPEEIRKYIDSIQKSFEYENISLVNTKQSHCTLIFLGEIDEAQVQETKSILEQTATRNYSVKCQLKCIGVFPDRNDIKVIWTGIYPKDQLATIQKSLEIELTKTGIYNSPAHQQFTPHITIGRVRDSRHKQDILDEIEKNMSFKTQYFKINELKLKQSVLLPRGPKYDDIAAYKLREPA